MLTQRCLRLLGHILRLDECHLPRERLVCASPQGRRLVGGQRMRWNDLELRDLRNCNLDGVWKILAQDRMSGGITSGLPHRK